MSAPRVSILLPVFDGERFLEGCLESLVTQAFGDFELLVADNGSTDGTPDIVQRFARADRRIVHYRSPENRGLTWNFNRLVPEVRGEYLKWAMYDDVLDPGYLAATVARLDQDPSAVLAHTRSIKIDETGAPLEIVEDGLCTDAATPHERFRELTRTGHSCVQISGLIRTAAVRRTGLHGPYPRSDRVLLAELGLQGRLVDEDDVLFMNREFVGRTTRRWGLRERYAIYTGLPVPDAAFPTWRLLHEFGRALRRAPISAAERARCRPSLWRFASGNRGSLKRELLSRGRVNARTVRVAPPQNLISRGE
ncbi:MAG: glycosyltransferase family 2 protein [Actinomycetes bacterium]